MKRSFSILFLSLFLLVQAMAVVHIADYGADEHEHNGQLCEFYLHAENAKASDIPAATSITLSPSNSFFTAFPAPFFTLQKHDGDALARAPPFFS